MINNLKGLPANHRRIVVALYNYNAREDTDVSFVKGDRMEVLDDTESDWWRVIVSGLMALRVMFIAHRLHISALNHTARGTHSVELCGGRKKC